MTFTLLPVSGKDFVGREELVKGMIKILSDKKTNTGYALFGIRRIGKTSIFKEVERRLSKRDDIVVVYFSLWDIVPSNIETFLTEFVITILEKYREKLSIEHRMRGLLKVPIEFLKDVLKKARVSISIRDEIEIFLTFKNRREKNLTQLVRRAFNLPEHLAKETNTKCILLIDEFPSILDLKNGEKIGEELVKSIRTIHENHKKTVICISGSIRKTMEFVALSSTSPFYKQFIPNEIKPLKIEDVKTLFERNKIKITNNALNKIYELTCGIPFYIQFLGRNILLNRVKKADDRVIDELVSNFLKEEGNVFFAEIFDSLSVKEQNFVVTMATSNLSSASKVSRVTNEPVTTVSRYLYYLLDKGILNKKSRGNYFFVDNMFKQWLIDRFG